MRWESYPEEGYPPRHRVDPPHHYPFLGPHQMLSFNERPSGWNSFYPGPYPPQYPTYLPQQQHPPYPQSINPPAYYSPPMYHHPYSGQSSPYPGTMSSQQPSYFQSAPSVINPQYSEIRKGP